MYKYKLIEEKMKTANVTNESLATLTKLNPNTISKVRNGKGTVKVATLEKVATALGISMPELFEEKLAA